MLTTEEIEQQINEHHITNHELAQQEPAKQGFKEQMASNVPELVEQEKQTKKKSK